MEENGYDEEQLVEIKRIIDTEKSDKEKSDLFDALSYEVQVEDKDRSRRVEFTIQTKAEETLEKISDLVDKKEKYSE